MMRALAFLFIDEYRFQFSPTYRWLARASTALITLTLYWFTSMALNSVMDQKQAWLAESYFDFILLGELIVAFPIAVAVGIMGAARFFATEGLHEELSMHPKGLGYPVVLQGVSYASIEFVSQVFILLGAILIFDFRVELSAAFYILLSVGLSLPIFAGLGLMVAAVYYRTGRGQGLFSQALSLMSVFAGVYFPLSVMPDWLEKLVKYASPLTLLVQSSREYSFGQSNAVGANLIALLVLGLLAMATGWWMFRWACSGRRRSPTAHLLHP